MTASCLNKSVNRSASYSDAEGHELEFPSPEIEIDCQIVTEAEACPVPRDLYIDSDYSCCTDEAAE